MALQQQQAGRQVAGPAGAACPPAALRHTACALALLQVGTHEQLLEARGAYAQLVQRQLARSTSSASLAGLIPRSVSAVSIS